MNNYTPVYLTQPSSSFEKLYIQVRNAEKRVLTDQQVKKLPLIESNHPHYKEWMKRNNTLVRFSHYLKTLQPENILDIGCGNGWFTYQLSTYCKHIVGLDVNNTELEQAARLFGNEKINFYYGNLFEKIFLDKKFQLIVFNASIQYFQHLHPLMERCFELLAPKGEIHILDSPFYSATEIKNAQTRTANYFNQLGIADAKNYYFHHQWNDLKVFRHQLLYKPGSLARFIKPSSSPFPWIKITRE